MEIKEMTFGDSFYIFHAVSDGIHHIKPKHYLPSWNKQQVRKMQYIQGRACV